MVYVTKGNDGRWRLELIGRGKGSFKSANHPLRNINFRRDWWIVKSNSKNTGNLNVMFKNIVFPKELVQIMIKNKELVLL